MSEQQKLSSVHFKNLKGLRNVTFNVGEGVTGIFGPNGCGKSTILHVLLCLYKPKTNRTNYKFSDFFVSVDDKKWVGCEFSYEGSYRDGKDIKPVNRTVIKTDRWMHDYGDRPDRDVYFIGIGSCLPDIEIEKDGTVHLNNGVVALNHDIEIVRIASDVMNSQYTTCKYHKSRKRSYIGCSNNGVDYISLSMGAGEQRLFRILDVVVNAPKYSLIVIDEIDLTLHSSALQKLIGHLVRIADDKKLQIVFTSHRQEIASRTDIAVRHIVPPLNPGGDTLCLEQTTYECVERLTGIPTRPLEIFVEDVVAKAIVEQVVAEMQLKAKTSVKTFGDASNAFKLIAGLRLSGKLTDNIIAVTDGDVYKSDEDRMKMMKDLLSGTEPDKDVIRAESLKSVLQLNLSEGMSPDEYVHDVLSRSAEDNEIVRAAKSVRGVYDNHQYLNAICDKLGGSHELELSRIMAEMAKTRDEWQGYTKPVRDWLQKRKLALNL